VAFLTAVGAAISAALASLTAILAAALVSIITVVVALISTIAVAVSYTAIMVVTGVIKVFSVMAGWIALKLEAAYIAAKPLFTAAYEYIRGLSIAIAEGMQTFLDAIHFKTLLKIHKILELTSPSYKRKSRQFFQHISGVSQALGLGAHYLNIMIENTRTVYLDVSAMMGRKYDLAEVTWLSSMNTFLQRISPHIESVQNDPARILDWINNFMLRPAIDAKGEFQQTLLGVLDGVVTVVDTTVGQVINLREDIDRAILQLPESISRKLYEEFRPRFEKFDAFIEDEYRPVATTITKVMNVISDTTESHTAKLGSLTHSILNPGDLLSNIDHLPELERLRQEAQIGEISSRSTNREMDKINEKVSGVYTGISEIFEASVLILPPVPYHVPEIQGLAYPIGKIPIVKNTWFVGDF